MAEVFGSASLDGSGTTSEPTATGEVTGATTTLEGESSFVSTVAPYGGRWRVVVCDIYGQLHGELEHAVLSPIRYELNQPETWSFTILQNDPKANVVLDERFRECQVWRGDQLLAWGPMVRVAVDKKNIVVNCQGALWHLTRRNVGKADRTNHVTNGDFEDGLTGWNFATNQVLIHYGAPHAQSTPPDGQVVTFPTVTNDRAMRLENFVNGADAFVNQSFEFTSTQPDGDIWTMKGYVYIESFPEDGAAFEDRSLYMARGSTTELNPDPLVQAVHPGAKKLIEHQFATIDEETPKNQWIRQEIEFEIPPNGDTELIEVRLYAPNGVVYWDAVSLTLMERLGYYGVDQALIAKGLVEHAQDADYSKSTVNIDTNTPLTGVLRTRVYVHAEHPNVYGSLEEFNTLDDGLDFSMEYTATTRTFTTHYPRKGDYKPDFSVVLGTNIADWTWAFDGESASSSIITLGSGNGSDREEGFAIDQSSFAYALTLEQVYVAPPETHIDSLDNMADERLRVAQNPVSLQVSTTRPQPGDPDPIGLVWPGDEIPVTIPRHAFLVDSVWRVVTVQVNPENNTVDYLLNFRTEPTT